MSRKEYIMNDKMKVEEKRVEFQKEVADYKSELLEKLKSATDSDERQSILRELDTLSVIEKTTVESECSQKHVDFDEKIAVDELKEKRKSNRMMAGITAGTSVLGLVGVFAMMAFEKSDGGGILQSKFIQPLLRILTK